MRKILVLSILTVIFLSSCTVTEILSISEGSSSSSTDINVQQFFIDVLQDYSEFMPSGNENIMDSAVSTFSSQIDATADAGNVVSVKDGENSYVLTFDFENIAALAEELGGQEQTIIQQTDNSLTFFCSIDNYTELERIVPFITFAIGEEAPDALRNSYITINVTVPGTITSITGAVQSGDNSFTYSFPLIDFLLLASPLSFSASWV